MYSVPTTVASQFKLISLFQEKFANFMFVLIVFNYRQIEFNVLMSATVLSHKKTPTYAFSLFPFPLPPPSLVLLLITLTVSVCISCLCFRFHSNDQLALNIKQKSDISHVQYRYKTCRFVT